MSAKKAAKKKVGGKPRIGRVAPPPEVRVFRVGMQDVTDAQMGLPAGEGGEGKWMSLTSFARAAGVTKGLISRFVTNGREGKEGGLFIRPENVRQGGSRKNGVEVNILGALLDLQVNRNSEKHAAATHGNLTQERVRRASKEAQKQKDRDEFELGTGKGGDGDGLTAGLNGVGDDAGLSRKLLQMDTMERALSRREQRARSALQTAMLRDEVGDRKAFQEAASAAGEKIRLHLTGLPTRLSDFVMKNGKSFKNYDDWRRGFHGLLMNDLLEMAGMVENMDLPKLSSGINSRMEKIMNTAGGA